jgi:hypothetical protein
MIKKIIDWIKNLFKAKKKVSTFKPKEEAKINKICEKHPDTYKKTCPSCREAANG